MLYKVNNFPKAAPKGVAFSFFRIGLIVEISRQGEYGNDSII